MLRHAGVRGPCLVIGEGGYNGPLAYVLHCSNRRPDQAGLLADLHGSTRVVWLRNRPPSHLWGVTWHRVHLHWLFPINAYVSPTPGSAKPPRT